MEAGQLAGGGVETDRLEFVAHHRYSRRKLARPTRDPAGDRAPVGLVLLAELGAQRRFLVADDQQVERDCGHAGIQQQRRRAEEPRLAQGRSAARRGRWGFGPSGRVRPRRTAAAGPMVPVSPRRRPRRPQAPQVQHNADSGDGDGDGVPGDRCQRSAATRKDQPGNVDAPRTWHDDGEQKVAQRKAHR